MADTTDNDDMPSARPKVFLSYTRADIEFAKPIIALLENAGIEVWWDGLLKGGVTYLHTTEAALEGADCVVVLWSAALASAWLVFLSARAY